LRHDGEAGALRRFLAHDRSQCGAGGIAADHETFGVDIEGGRFARDPFGRSNRIVHGGGKFVLRRKPVVDRDQAAAGRMRKRRGNAVMRHDAAGNEAAAVKEHEARRVRAGRSGRIKAIGKRSAGAGQHAVGRGYARRISACELHQLRQRLPPRLHARPASRLRRGRSHHGQQTLCERIERHGPFLIPGRG
jgi:hypothetical protein